MKCSVCGGELADNSKFCIFCGSTVKQPEVPVTPATPTYAPPSYSTPTYTPPGYAAPAAEQPTYTPPGYAAPTYTPPVYNAPAAPAAPAPSWGGEAVVAPVTADTKKKKKKSKKPLIFGSIVAAIAAVAAIVALFILNIPTVKIQRAFNKTSRAYAGIADDIGLTDSLAFLEDGIAYSESITLTFEGINKTIANAAEVDLSDLESLGVRMNRNVSLEERRMSGNIAVVYKDQDLANLQIGLDDDTAWVSMPALISGRYGVETSKLGKALAEMGADMGDGESLGFNIFDLIELAKTMAPSEEVAKQFEDAAKALWKAVEIEENGSEEIEVNDEDVTCSAYTLTFTQDALEDYLDALEDPMEDYVEHVFDVYKDLCLSIGMPEDIAEEAFSSVDVDMGEAVDIMKEALDEIGDVELEVYIKGGYVMAVMYELKIDGEKLTIEAYMGGGDKYVDDFSLIIEVEDVATIELTSSGNHTGKGGEFTDETELEITIDGESLSLTSEATYSPKEKEDNFQWELSLGGNAVGATVGLEAKGQLDFAKKGMSIALDELSVTAMGMDLVTLGVNYSIGEYTGAEAAGSVKLINKLTESDMERLAAEIEENAMTLAEDIMKKVPFLEDMYNSEVEEMYPAIEGTYPSYYG